MIQILDTHTINKIAAGEVVERPSSVVKELVENSIDAKASSITVEIKNGGIDLIRVTDNGIGIPKDEVEVAFLRHATSKITNIEDLYKVTSLGFRGEALASIAAVSHVELITKTQECEVGKRVVVAGGKIESREEIAAPNGTSFIMRHLFYNVPARKEFLSSKNAETGRISDFMYKLALSHPEIAFKYINNGKVQFTTTGNKALSHTILNLYGKEHAKESFECYGKSNDIICSGMLGTPILNRSTRNFEHFVVNGRYIKSSVLQNAVEDAYKTLVMVNKFPFVVVHITMPPQLVDVNVHPNKLQIRFKDPDSVYKLVYNTVKSAIDDKYLVPEANLDNSKVSVEPVLDKEELKKDTFFTERKDVKVAEASELIGKNTNELNTSSIANRAEANKNVTFERLFKPEAITIENYMSDKLGKDTESNTIDAANNISSNTDLSENINNNIRANNEIYKSNLGITDVSTNYIKSNTTNNMCYDGVIGEADIKQSSIQNNTTNNADINEISTHDAIREELNKIMPKKYTIVGQFFNTFWVVEYENKLFLIDQHAAHERVLYEKFMSYFKQGDVATQLLLMPETLHFTLEEIGIIEENEEIFRKLGFDFEIFGSNDIIVREVPYILNSPIPVSTFKDVLDEIQTSKVKDITDIKADQIITMSCKSAVKAHHKLSEDECKNLIDSLLALENPFTCPHGRPTIVSFTKSDIEKMFKRIV